MPDTKSKPEKAAGPNFFSDLFDKIFSVFGLNDGPDRQKNLLLKEVKKSLKKNAKKYIRIGPDLIETGFAKFFYEIYIQVGSAQSLLDNAVTSGALKSIVIESCLTPELAANRQALEEGFLLTRAKEIPLARLSEEVKQNLGDYMAGFDLERTKKIDSLYNQILSFLDFVQFNYFFLLKKFDSSLPERDFVYNPRFEAISGDYILEDLKDFLERSQNFPANSDWDLAFDVLKAYRNLEVVSRAPWKKLMSHYHSLRKSGILNQILMHLERDPFYKVLTPAPNERIVEPYLSMMKTQVELLVQKIIQEKKQGKIAQLVKLIFGSESVSRTKNYTEKSNMLFSKKLLGGYTLIEPINFLKAFLLDFYKKDVRDLVNLLLVKGQWSTANLSQPFSESFHFLMNYSDKLLAFDESLAEDAEKGQKLKTFFTRSDRDQNALGSLKLIIKDVNAQAKVFIMESASHLIVIGKNIKMAIEDFEKPKHELIRNWKSLEQSTEKPLKEWMANTYKSIYYFIQLLQFYVKDNPSS